MPGLRAIVGYAPAATCTRIRCSRLNRCPIGHKSTSTRRTPSSSVAPGPNRLTPSHTLYDRPSGCTSHTRTTTSTYGVLERTYSSARTGPIASTAERSAGEL
ncbi:hypothetical protein GCM10020001_091300 [Nonomuraea salmonea]